MIVVQINQRKKKNRHGKLNFDGNGIYVNV